MAKRMLRWGVVHGGTVKGPRKASSLKCFVQKIKKEELASHSRLGRSVEAGKDIEIRSVIWIVRDQSLFSSKHVALKEQLDRTLPRNYSSWY